MGGALISSLIFSYGQNLVINTTFEAACIKKGYGEITEAHGWTNANGGTTDLFDKKKLSKVSPNGIPYNYMGYQVSEDGQNYAGIVAYYDDGLYCDPMAVEEHNYVVADKLGINDGYKRYTEYLQAELMEPLVAGVTYEVSFRVNLADNSGRGVSCLGALLTPEKVKLENNTFLPFSPQFMSHRIITDSLNWVTLSGAYIANGGEKYMTIGCFKDAEFQVVKVVGENRNDSRKAYYYISGVRVAPYASPKQNMDAMAFGVDYVELMNVQFASASAEIMPSFYPDLNEVANWMIKYPNYKFFIVGYADQLGGDMINNPLSKTRAVNVKNYLVSKGAKEENILTEGFGSSDPLVHKLKSRKNRRVEIYLYSVVKLPPL